MYFYFPFTIAGPMMSSRLLMNLPLRSSSKRSQNLKEKRLSQRQQKFHPKSPKSQRHLPRWRSNQIPTENQRSRGKPQALSRIHLQMTKVENVVF